MKFRDIYSRAPFIENSLPPEDVEDREPVRRAQESAETKPLFAAESEPGEVEKIVDHWRQVLGVTLKPENIMKHLDTLRRWQRRFQNHEERLL